MSDFLGGLQGVAASLLFYGDRNIGGMIPDVMVRESHRDELEITQHPVEIGAPVSDHYYVKPVELQLEMGWTNSSLSAINITSLLEGNLPTLSFDESRVKEVYGQLLSLQKSGVLISIVTGKRIYNSMLISGLSTETTAETEYALIITANCREVIIVTTSAASIAPRAQQALPASTASAVDQGTVQLKAVNQSGLSIGHDALFGG